MPILKLLTLHLFALYVIKAARMLGSKAKLATRSCTTSNKEIMIPNEEEAELREILAVRSCNQVDATNELCGWACLAARLRPFAFVRQFPKLQATPVDFQPFSGNIIQHH